ncbi:MAG: nucleotidyltransferase [Halanaerobiales bacterium]
MTAVTGIITEYNPFHHGHIYHLEQSKKIGESDKVVCILNGNFTQRGKPALTDKWSRTRMALSQGVNIVLELPFVYGIRSAEYFAYGAIYMLDKINIVDNIVFGSERGDIRPLQRLADILVEEPPEFKEKLHLNLKKGNSFAKARHNAIRQYFKRKDLNISVVDSLASPNNILGIEYLKALKKLKSDIIPMTIKRVGEDYYSDRTDREIASASAIRKIFYDKNWDKVQEIIPKKSWEVLKKDIKSKKIPIKREYFGTLILNNIRKKTIEDLKNYTELKNGFENRFKKAAQNCGDYFSLVENIKTSVLPQTRVQRNLLHVLFELTAEQFEFMDKAGIQYIRVLGFDKKGEKLMGEIASSIDIPLIIQPAKYVETVDIGSEDPLKRMLSYDILAGNIYSLLYNNNNMRYAGRDYYKQLIKY